MNLDGIFNKSKSEHKFPTYFDVNNVKIKDNQEIANYFNNFFTNCGPNLANKIDISGKPEFKSYLDGNNVDTLFKFLPISVEQTVLVINN